MTTTVSDPVVTQNTNENVLVCRTDELCDIMKRDVLGLETKWALFCSAARSYKRNFLLRPFPTFAIKGGVKDFELINEYIDAMPCLNIANTCNMNDGQIDLLLWVYKCSAYRIRPISVDKVLESLKSRGLDTWTLGTNANMAFEVSQNTLPAWQEYAQGKNILCGFHGSRLSNFYSILNHGLLSNLNKTAVFGEGTYLSEDLKVSLNWSPSSHPGSARVSLGERMSCVAVCDVINDHAGLSHGETKRGGVPEKYLLVRNDQLITVRYLLLFTEPKTSYSQPIVSSARRFVNANRFALLVLAYVIVLLAVGLANSRNFNFYWRKFSAYFTERQQWAAFEDPS